MDIVTSLAARAYGAAAAAAQPRETDGGAAVFEDFASVLRTGEETAKAAATGAADPHALVQALAATEMAVETAVTVRDKVVEAYQEILRMPV